MKIETKFSIGDKVWVMTPAKSNYMWGKIVSIDVSVKCNLTEVVYNVKNRFYDRELFILTYYPDRNWKTEQYLNYRESEVFTCESELIDVFMAEKDREIMQLSQLKKGLFNL